MKLFVCFVTVVAFFLITATVPIAYAQFSGIVNSAKKAAQDAAKIADDAKKAKDALSKGKTNQPSPPAAGTPAESPAIEKASVPIPVKAPQSTAVVASSQPKILNALKQNRRSIVYEGTCHRTGNSNSESETSCSMLLTYGDGLENTGRINITGRNIDNSSGGVSLITTDDDKFVAYNEPTPTGLDKHSGSFTATMDAIDGSLTTQFLPDSYSTMRGKTVTISFVGKLRESDRTRLASFGGETDGTVPPQQASTGIAVDESIIKLQQAALKSACEEQKWSEKGRSCACMVEKYPDTRMKRLRAVVDFEGRRDGRYNTREFQIYYFPSGGVAQPDVPMELLPILAPGSRTNQIDRNDFSLVLLDFQGMCLDGTTSANTFHQRCLATGDSLLPLKPGQNKESFCSCSAVQYQKLFEASPNVSSKTEVDNQTRAYSMCRQ